MWGELEELDCPCLGTGWAEIVPDKWETCDIHYHGQLHPESRLLLLDEPKRLEEEEHRAYLQYQIQQCKNEIETLHLELKTEQNKLAQLVLELVKKTPTIRAFPAVSDPDSESK